MCYCEHCRNELPRGLRSRSSPHRRPAGSGAARPTSCGGRSGSSTCGASGTAEVRQINPDSCVIPNTGGGATSRLDMQTDRRAGADADGRPAGAPRAHGAVGERQERQGIPRHDGPQADRRHLQRRGRGAVPLEGQRAERGRDPALGGRRASPTACGPGSRSSAGMLHDERWLQPVEEIFTGATPRWERYLRNERPLARVGLVYSQQTAWFRGGDASASGSRTRRSAGIRRSSRRASPSRWCTTGCSTPTHLAPFKTLILPNIAALSDAQCAQLARFRARGAAASLPPPRPASTTSGARARSDFGLADLFGVYVRGPPSRVRCRTPTCASSTRRPRGTPCCSGSRTRRGSSTGVAASR